MAQQTINTPRETTIQRIATALENILNKIVDTSRASNIDYDNTESDLTADKVQGAIDELAEEKVDKVQGKGLSTNDYTTAEKTKLAGIEAQANKTVVDSAMSDSSTNPLQNKVITKELEGATTTTGNPITVTDAAPVNAVNLSMDLEPIQDLHGYDHPWVGGAGKNKWDEETIYGYRVIENGLYYYDANELCSKNLIPVSPSTSYRLVGGGNSVITYNSNQERISGFFISAGEIFTTPSDCYYIHFNLGFSYGNVYNHDVGIIYPSSEMTYSPYTNICPISGRTEEVITQKDNPTNPTVTKTYTIQLGQTVYGGQLDVTRGKMVVDRGYKTIADFESMSEGGDNFATGDIGAKRFSPTQLSTIISSHCPTVPQSPDPTQFSISGLHWVDGFQLWNTGCTNFNELKERYGELQVCYELATPFTIDLTPTQIKMLENTNTITTDYEGDTITLEYQPNNAIGEAVRAVEESYDPEFAVRPVLKKIAFSGTTDTDGSVTLINASDIPSNHRIIPLHITDMTIDGNAGTYFVEYEPYNSGDSVKGYCYFYMSGSQMFPVGKAITGNFYYYDLEG